MIHPFDRLVHAYSKSAYCSSSGNLYIDMMHSRQVVKDASSIGLVISGVELLRITPEGIYPMMDWILDLSSIVSSSMTWEEKAAQSAGAALSFLEKAPIDDNIYADITYHIIG